MSEWSGHYQITHIPIVGLVVCNVPVLPGSPTAQRNGEPIPLEDRSEMCAQAAHWLMGMQPLCDHHLREVLDMIEPDGQKAWDEIVSETRWGDPDVTPWLPETRNSQEEAALMRDEWKEHSSVGPSAGPGDNTRSERDHAT